MGSAIPIDTARDVVSQLESSGKVVHAFLGITGATIDSTLSQAVNLPVDRGVLDQDVVPGGPADNAGIKGGDTSATIDGASLSLGGDIITAIDGEKVSSMDEVVNIVNAAKPGDTIKVTVLRGGSTKTDGHLGDHRTRSRTPSTPNGPFGNCRSRTASRRSRAVAAPTALPFAPWIAAASRAAAMASAFGRPGHERAKTRSPPSTGG